MEDTRSNEAIANKTALVLFTVLTSIISVAYIIQLIKGEAGMDKIVEWAEELQSLAQAGLNYVKDEYDRERFQRVREIAAVTLARRKE